MNENIDKCYQFLFEKLGIEKDANIAKDYKITVGDRELLIDLGIESGNALILVELKQRISEDVIYRIYSISHLISQESKGKRRVRLICVGKSLKYSTEFLSQRLGVETFIIPAKIYDCIRSQNRKLDENIASEQRTYAPIKITKEKAWKVISCILQEKPVNILELSKLSGISYAWSNAIYHKLLNSDLIYLDLGIKIKDIDRLLNAVSWERPLDGLLVDSINTYFRTASECINEISLNLNKQGIDYAFTAHSSAIYYGSSIIRDDTAYIYLPNLSKDRGFIKSFSQNNVKGCRLKVYSPDRNIMEKSEIFSGVRVVDIYQNLLDLAGLGIDGRISSKELVNKIARY